MDDWKIIHGLRRRENMRLVWDDDLPAGAIAERFAVPCGAVSKHRAVMRAAGYVTARRAGNRRFYRADKDGLGPLRPALESMWAATLDDLAAAIEADLDADREAGHG